MRFVLKTAAERRRDRIVVGVLVAAILLLLYWFVEAESIFDRDVPGKYRYIGTSETAILNIAADHSFREVLQKNGASTTAEGIWHISGEGHISFSHSFVMLSGQQPCYANPSCGWVENYFGLMRIEMGLNRPGLVFKKHMF